MHLRIILIFSALLFMVTPQLSNVGDACLPPEPAINEVTSSYGEELPLNGVLRVKISAGLRRVDLPNMLTIERGRELLNYELIEPVFNYHPLIRITSPLNAGDQIIVRTTYPRDDRQTTYDFVMTEAIAELDPTVTDAASLITDTNADAIPGNSCQPIPVINRERKRSAVFTFPTSLMQSNSMLYVNGRYQTTLNAEAEWIDLGETAELYIDYLRVGFSFGEVFIDAGPVAPPTECLEVVLVSPSGEYSTQLSQCEICMFQTVGIDEELIERTINEAVCSPVDLGRYLDEEEPTWPCSHHHV